MLRYSVFGSDMLRLVDDDHRRQRATIAGEREVRRSRRARRRAVRSGRREHFGGA